MATSISSNLLGAGTTTIGGNRAQNQQRQASARAELPKPPRVQHMNYIPSADSMQTLIGNATLSMQQGTYWDRGSILNLLI